MDILAKFRSLLAVRTPGLTGFNKRPKPMSERHLLFPDGPSSINATAFNISLVDIKWLNRGFAHPEQGIKNRSNGCSTVVLKWTVAYARGFFWPVLLHVTNIEASKPRCCRVGTTLYIHHHTNCFATKVRPADSPASALTVALLPLFFRPVLQSKKQGNYTDT